MTLSPKNRLCRNQHSLAFHIPSASTNAYLHSFFLQTHRENMSIQYIPPYTPLLYSKTGVCRGIPIFLKFLIQNIDCGYSLEPPRRGCFNVYPQSMFWAKILKISSFSIFAAEKYHIAWASLRNVLKIGMNSLILWSPLLKFRMIVCLNLLLLWELGTNPLRSNPILLVWYCQVDVSPINYILILMSWQMSDWSR